MKESNLTTAYLFGALLFMVCGLYLIHIPIFPYDFFGYIFLPVSLALAFMTGASYSLSRLKEKVGPRMWALILRKTSGRI